MVESYSKPDTGAPEAKAHLVRIPEVGKPPIHSQSPSLPILPNLLYSPSIYPPDAKTPALAWKYRGQREYALYAKANGPTRKR